MRRMAPPSMEKPEGREPQRRQERERQVQRSRDRDVAPA
ncbi:hypothetical protein Tchar_00683 [Tepidimonas charontis]|jgi:hypothetical protein|uniref:Uncharacterized protein n=1 Tax=Tepidimonas charontis TaxID=2267262 RepID=A0A554XI31_9BURK|nr:hypothetical protein Tchar_00683 [Tepidimonas charontis]